MSRDNGLDQQFKHAQAQFRSKKHHQFGAICGNDSSFTNKADLLATDGINLKHKQEQRQSSKDARPARQRGQRPPGGALETVQVNTDKVEALRVTNQHLLKELEQLTRQIRHPQETRQARKDQNHVTREEQHLDPRREADREGELATPGSMILTNPPERIATRRGRVTPQIIP